MKISWLTKLCSAAAQQHANKLDSCGPRPAPPPCCLCSQMEQDLLYLSILLTCSNTRTQRQCHRPDMKYLLSWVFCEVMLWRCTQKLGSTFIFLFKFIAELSSMTVSKDGQQKWHVSILQLAAVYVINPSPKCYQVGHGPKKNLKLHGKQIFPRDGILLFLVIRFKRVIWSYKKQGETSWLTPEPITLTHYMNWVRQVRGG